MLRIFWGFVAVAGGAIIIRYTEWLLYNIGRMDFFERKLSTMGGSRFGYKLIGIVLIFIGFAMITNLTEGFAEMLVGFFVPKSY